MDAAAELTRRRLQLFPITATACLRMLLGRGSGIVDRRLSRARWCRNRHAALLLRRRHTRRRRTAHAGIGAALSGRIRSDLRGQSVSTAPLHAGRSATTPWLDCTGAGGDRHCGPAVGVLRRRILVHGVNKSAVDLEMAAQHAGVIVVDNLAELHRSAAARRNEQYCARLRCPGVAVDTHAYRQTGQEGQQFGVSPQEAM